MVQPIHELKDPVQYILFFNKQKNEISENLMIVSFCMAGIFCGYLAMVVFIKWTNI